VFIGVSIESGERLSHHVELGLAVSLENVSVTLPEHFA